MRRPLLLRRGRALALLALLLAPLAGCPRSAQGLLEHADSLESRKRFPEALAAYRDALRRLGPDDGPSARAIRARALAHLGDLCYLDLNDSHCARDAYQRLVDRFPDAPESYEARIHYSELLRDRLGDVPGAIAQLEALVAAYPDRPGADDFQYQVAEGYFGLGDYAQTRTEARALLDRFPQSRRGPQARFLLASCYELEGRRSDAIAAYEELLDRTQDPELVPRAQLALAKLLELEGQNDRALTTLLECLKGYPDPQTIQREIDRLEGKLARARSLEHPDAFDHGVAAAHPRPRRAPSPSEPMTPNPGRAGAHPPASANPGRAGARPPPTATTGAAPPRTPTGAPP
ncbi:MAG: tetratricopeptide repeat protein [Deltaproteobacteria bacterium]